MLKLFECFYNAQQFVLCSIVIVLSINEFTAYEMQWVIDEQCPNALLLASICIHIGALAAILLWQNAFLQLTEDGECGFTPATHLCSSTGMCPVHVLTPVVYYWRR